jgi:hypothetical protein
MAAEEQMHNAIEPANDNVEDKEAEIVPLQRCPYLYIKHTAAKGNNSSTSSIV